MTSLCPGTVFQSSGLNHHSTPCPPSATPADIDKQLSRKPFNGRDWPRDSPVARVYDVGNSSTKLVLLNRRLKKHSRLRGLTDFNGDILAPSPDRHMSEEPAVNKQHHETCCNSSSERFHPQISLDLSWKNSTQRPPSTFTNGSHVNQNRHISCRVPRDQPLDELYRRRPYTSASMHSDLGCLWPVLADPDLSFGERRYLYSVACIYNVNPMKQTKQEQYYQLLYKELMKGYQPSEVHQRYLHYLTSPRKTQFGKLDPEKRAKSAPPPQPPTIPAEHGQTTTTRVTSSRTASRMSKRSHANAKSVTPSSSSRPSSISIHPSTSSNKRSKSVSSRSQSASTVKSGSSQQLTANEVKHKESNDRDVVQANHKNIPHVGDDQGKLTRNEEQDHGNKPQSNAGSPPEREESNENESDEKSPREITVISEDIKPSTATHINRDDLDKREGDRGRENGSFSSTGSRSNHHDKQSHSPSFFPDGKKTSDKEHEASHDRESTDEEVITTIHRTQSYEQGRQSNTYTEEKSSTHSRPSTGTSQGKEYMAPNRLAKSTSQGSSLNENNQPLNESQAQDENPLVTDQTDQGGDSDDALPEFSTQERNHDVDKIEY